MAATLRKTGALLTKDLRDLVKNPSTLVCCLMPVAFIAFFTYMMGDEVNGNPEAQKQFLTFMLAFSFCMSAGMASMTTATSAIAEEREKHTLRTLMLANVSPGEILLSRGIVSIAAIALINLLCYLLVGGPLDGLAAAIAIGTAGSTPLVLVGLLMGLIARDQMTAGVYSVPVLIVALAPVFGVYSEGLARVVSFLPTGGMFDLLKLLLTGNLLTADALAPVAVTLAWIVVAAVAFVLLFKRLARDN